MLRDLSFWWLVPQVVGSGAFYLDVVVDCWFIVDLLVNFRSAYRDEDTKALVVNRKVIAVRYLRGWFAIDFVSCLPLNYVLLLSSGNNDNETGAAFKWLKVARLLRLLRLTRLSKLQGAINSLENEHLFLADHANEIAQVMLSIVMLWLIHVMVSVLGEGCTRTSWGGLRTPQSMIQ